MDSVRIWLRQFTEDLNARVARFCARWIRKVINAAISDHELMGALKDITSTAEFVKQYLGDVPEFKSRDQLYRWALNEVPSDAGLFLEFGVYKGNSINRLAGIKPNVTFYGFDSFVGLPEGWTIIAKKGAFDTSGALPPVRSNVVLTKGFFEQTLQPYLQAHPGEAIRFLHVDCDLYSATKTILDAAKSRLAAGTVIIFDELINYPGWQEQEYKAFMEFASETGVHFEYIGYVRNGGQVAVQLLQS